MLHPHYIHVYGMYIRMYVCRCHCCTNASAELSLPSPPLHHGCTGALGVWCLEGLVELKPVLVSRNVPQNNLQHTIRASQYTMLHTDQCHTVVQAILYTQTFVCSGVGMYSCLKQYATHRDTSDRCTRPAPAVEDCFMNSLCLYIHPHWNVFVASR